MLRFVFVILLSFSFIHCSSDSKPQTTTHHEGEGCTCSLEKAGNTTWCNECNAGYVDGEKIKDKEKFNVAASKKEKPSSKEGSTK